MLVNVQFILNLVDAVYPTVGAKIFSPFHLMFQQHRQSKQLCECDLAIRPNGKYDSELRLTIAPHKNEDDNSCVGCPVMQCI